MHLPQQKNVRASLTAAGISGCWLSLCLYASARLPVPSPLLNLLLNPLQLLLQNLLQPLSLKSLALHALSRLNRVLPQPQHLQNNLRRQAQLQQQLSRLQSNPHRQAQLQQQLSRLQSNPHRQAQLHLAGATATTAQPATEQPAAAQPAAAPAPEPAKAAGGISIASLMAKAKQENTTAAVPEKQLDFMGPSEQEKVTIEKVKEAWEKLAAEYSTKYPTLIRFAATIKNTVPVLEEDNLTIDFLVGNSSQKMWIEKNAGKQMAEFLRKNLKNNKVHLAVKIKTQKQIDKKLYMTEEQEYYLKKKNSEVGELKDDLGLELK